jgi:sec-independent protein translocase protein TatA
MNLGWGELLVIFVIVLLILGPRRLPELGRSLGQAIRSFQRAMRGERDEKKHDKDQTDDESKE